MTTTLMRSLKGRTASVAMAEAVRLLRLEAERYEHGAEFNANEAARLSRQEQLENTRAIRRSRELYEAADALDKSRMEML